MGILYQALLSALISLLTSSVVTAYFSHKLATSETKRELKRQKLELLYLTTITFNKILCPQAFGAAGYHNKRVDKKVYHDLFLENGKEGGDALNTMIMLCNLYFPNMVPYLDEILKHRDIMSDGIQSAFRGEPPDYDKGAVVMNEYKNNAKLIKDFTEELFRTGTNINK